MILAYVTGVKDEKRSKNLVLVSCKYSKTYTKLGIIICHRCESLFSLQSKKLNVWKNVVLLKKSGDNHRKTTFHHIYVTGSHNVTHSTIAPSSLNPLSTPGLHMQVPAWMIMTFFIKIKGEKRPINLVLVSHKYLQRNTNFGIKFCHGSLSLLLLQSESYKIECCVKNCGCIEKIRWKSDKKHILSHLCDC